MLSNAYLACIGNLLNARNQLKCAWRCCCQWFSKTTDKNTAGFSLSAKLNEIHEIRSAWCKKCSSRNTRPALCDSRKLCFCVWELPAALPLLDTWRSHSASKDNWNSCEQWQRQIFRTKWATLPRFARCERISPVLFNSNGPRNPLRRLTQHETALALQNKVRPCSWESIWKSIRASNYAIQTHKLNLLNFQTLVQIPDELFRNLANCHGLDTWWVSINRSKHLMNFHRLVQTPNGFVNWFKHLMTFQNLI